MVNRRPFYPSFPSWRWLDRVRIVLVAPTHPGNIGATARAMRTMGLSSLWLVRPKRFPSAEATERAAGAYEVLERARIVDDLPDAIADCHWVVATTARPRRFAWRELDPPEAGREVVRRAASGPVAVVFGRESAGLTNAEIDRCQAVLRIPTAPDFRSLNIAAAVQIAAYEIARVAAGAGDPAAGRPAEDAAPGREEGAEQAARSGPAEARDDGVTAAELEGLFAHFEAALADIGYLDPVRPRRLMRRLRRLFARADLDRSELNILRGVLAAAQRAAGSRASDRS